MAPLKYPLPFHVSASAKQGISTNWTAHAGAYPTPITVSVPSEFGGAGLGFSPEDLYALALENCFIATFKVFAEKSNLSFETISVDAILELDQIPEVGLGMARIAFNISVTGSSNPDLAQRVLEKTSRGCMILNSVKTEKEFHFNVI